MRFDSIGPSPRQVGLAVLTTVLALGVMAALKWMGVPAGDFLDWLVAVAGFWWLLGITTVPWNLYFGARAVQSEMVLSRKRGLLIERDDAKFVGKTARRSLAAALLLHGASALGFGALALSGVSPVGWLAAAAAVGLTVFRPIVRLYQHVARALGAIGQRTKYPRDDVQTVLEKLASLEHRMDAAGETLRVDLEGSWAHAVERRLEGTRADLTRTHRHLEVALEKNEAAHRKLARDAERAAERLGEDSAFLGNVREIIRFVKDA